MALPSFHSAFVAASSVAAGNKRTAAEEEEEERERMRAAAKAQEEERLQQLQCSLPQSPPIYFEDRLHAADVEYMSGVNVGGGSDGGYSSRSEPDSDFEYDFPGDGLAFCELCRDQTIILLLRILQNLCLEFKSIKDLWFLGSPTTPLIHLRMF